MGNKNLLKYEGRRKADIKVEKIMDVKVRKIGDICIFFLSLKAGTRSKKCGVHGEFLIKREGNGDIRLDVDDHLGDLPHH